jgi:hypothetical protein
MNKEQASTDAAADYRRQALRNYASLVSPATDFPLSRFQSRTDPATKAVGYDNSTMVFHMLRQKVGDAAFWAALQDIYQEFLFERASWRDLQHIFERRAGRSLDLFFRQWIDRPGAPQMRLENVLREDGDQGYRTIGHLVQEKPYFDVTLELTLDTEGGAIEQTIHLSGRQSRFEIPSDTAPRSLTADLDYHLFRQLTPEEIPPTVNTLKGSTSTMVVIAKRMGRAGRPIARYFARAMGVEPFRTIDEDDFSLSDAANQASVKIPHYGRYSYLAFRDGRNRVKGTWEANTSPLMVRWDE